MGRLPLALGTHGAIRYYRTEAGYRACTLVRDYDGRTRSVERHGPTRAAAERALKLALRDRTGAHPTEGLTGDSTVAAVADAWHAGLSDLSPVTLQAYRDRLDRQIVPRLGQIRVRELSVGLLDRQLRAIVDDHGQATGKTCRSVLSGMCTLATRHNALPHNPVRDLGPIRGKPKKAPAAMTVAQLRQLRAALTYDDRAIARDLPDLVDFLMATGLRIGEAAGLAWDEVDLDAGTIEVRAAVVRVRGRGLVRKATKTDAGTRTLLLPAWCVIMLRQRAASSAPPAGSGPHPVFPAPLGGWRDPSNTRPTSATRSSPLASTG